MDRLSKLFVIDCCWEVEKTNIFLAIVSIFLSSFYSVDGDKLVVHYPLLFFLCIADIVEVGQHQQ